MQECIRAAARGAKALQGEINLRRPEPPAAGDAPSAAVAEAGQHTQPSPGQRGASSWHDTSQLREREACVQPGQLSLSAGALTSLFSGFPGQEGRKSTIAGTEHLVINHLGAFSFLKLFFDSKPAKCVCL